MPRNSQVGMFSVPNFLGGSAVGAPQALRSAGLGGSSGSLVNNPSIGGGGPITVAAPFAPAPAGPTGPQAKQSGATGTGLVGVTGLNDPCAQSMLSTGQPTPCPPGQQHDPVGSCGPCISIPSPAGETPTGLSTPASTPVHTSIPSSCPQPTSPNPGKPGSYNWNTASCTWDPAVGIHQTRGEATPLSLKDRQIRDILTGKMASQNQRGAASRQEFGQFGRSGGGVGGGAMSDLETFTNPLLAGGSPYLGKNVSQFAQGGRMENPYTTYPDGGRADFMSGIRSGMNSAVAAEQIQNVVRNNRAPRRFTSGGKF